MHKLYLTLMLEMENMKENSKGKGKAGKKGKVCIIQWRIVKFVMVLQS